MLTLKSGTHCVILYYTRVASTQQYPGNVVSMDGVWVYNPLCKWQVSKCKSLWIRIIRYKVTQLAAVCQTLDSIIYMGDNKELTIGLTE